jgi:hypothetical protein
MFAVVVGLGLTGLTASATFTAPIALAKSANQTGPYDPTDPCVGDNQGNGNAPCNGTVGQADDKNPDGERPGGSDNNKGYECDGNKGVGDNGGNPAHTACKTGGGGSTTDTCPDGSPMPVSGICTSGGGGGGGEVLSSNASNVVGSPGTAAPAIENSVAGAVEIAPAAAPAPQLAAATAAPAQLAFTGPGALTYALAAVGSLMVLFGIVLVRMTRQPSLRLA